MSVTRRGHSLGRGTSAGSRFTRKGWAALGMTTIFTCASFLAFSSTATAATPSPLTPVTITEQPTVTALFIAVAQQQGIFKKNGLDVKVTDAANIALLPAAVAAGQFDFGTTVAPIFLSALEKNLPIVASAGGQLEANNNHNLDLIVKADSPITKMSQLVGKTVGTATVQGNYTYCMQYDMKKQGLGATSATYTAMPFANMAAELDAGQIAAALVGPPVNGSLIASGYRSIGDPCLALGLPQVGSFQISNASWAKAHPKAVTAMQTSIKQAGDYMAGHRSSLNNLIVKYTGIPLKTAKNYKIPKWSPSANEGDLRRWSKALVSLGVLTSAPDLTGAVITK